MTDLLTILIPTSPIPSHPSTEVIEESISRTRAYPELSDCEIIITIDGLREEQSDREAHYEEYKQRLLWKCSRWTNVVPVLFEEHAHQATMARVALEMVRTPLVMYLEHDCYWMGDVPFEGICNALLNHPDRVKCVRGHIFDSVLPVHEYLMHGVEEFEGVPLLSTSQWSQRPHITTTDYYRWLIDTYFAEDARTMIEDCIYPIGYHQYADGLINLDHFGMWIYCPDGNTESGMLRSGTSDGRKDDKKLPMHFSYNGEAPYAAPVNRR